ncbi:MAG: sigma-70 family RNA polymerase sigma factor [Planctomycetota bacterium]|nr:sigma-70 family RNA polymerase sigma factor [Planctomycetota bacterium]
MQSTSLSLSDLLKNREDQGSWEVMVELYQPLIEKWLLRFGAPANDREDLAQSVLLVVSNKLGAFKHSGNTGAFRSWLRSITRNCLLEFWRENKIRPIATGNSSFQESLEQLADECSELSRIWQEEYDQEVLKSLLKRIQDDFQQQSGEAFRRVAIEGIAAKEVAQQLGITVNSVFIAKSRIMNKLRLVGKDLLD